MFINDELNSIAEAYKKMKAEAEDPAAKPVGGDASAEDEKKDEVDEACGRKGKKEALDPVGKADGDIDNDGDEDESDEYLAKRRKAISKNVKEEVELNESSTRDYVDNILPKALKKAGIDCKVSKKAGYTSYKCGDYEIVNDGVGIKVKENGKEVAYYSKPKLDYKKAVAAVNEEVELVEFMKFDAQDAIGDFKKGKVAKIKSNQSVTATVMPVRGNSWDTDNGYVPVLKNFSRKGKMTKVDLKAGQEVAIDTQRGNVYGMVGDKFFYTSTGNVDLNEGVEVEEALETDGPRRGKLNMTFAKSTKARKYQSDKAQQRRDQNAKNDPGAAKKHLALSVTDKKKAANKAIKKGIKFSPYDMVQGKKPNKMQLIQKGLDPKMAREEVELEEAKGKLVKNMRVKHVHNGNKGTVVKGGDLAAGRVEVEWDDGKTTVAAGKYLEPIKESVELEEGKKLRNVLSDREFEKSMKKALADKSNYKGGKVNWSFIDADVYMELTAKGYDLRHPSINYMDRFDKLADKLDPENVNESVELDENFRNRTLNKIAVSYGFEKGTKWYEKNSWVHPKTGETLIHLGNGDFGHSRKDGSTVKRGDVRGLDQHLASKGYKATNESVELDEAKTHPAYDELMALGKKLNDRAIKALAGKISRFTATGDRGMMKGMAKDMKSLDAKNQAAVMKILNKKDPSLGKSIVFKMSAMTENAGYKSETLKNLVSDLTEAKVSMEAIADIMAKAKRPEDAVKMIVKKFKVSAKEAEKLMAKALGE